MESIGKLLENIPNKRSVEEIMSDVYKHDGVREFIEKQKDYIDQKMIAEANSVLLEFVNMFNDQHFQPILLLYDNRIAITYKKRDTPLNLKYRDKVSSRLIYDNSTRKFKGAKLSEYEVTINNTKAVGYINNFLDTYQYGDKSRGMWLHGKFGIGKSYLVGAFATELNSENIGVNFISATQLMNDLYEMNRSNSMDMSVQKKIEYLQKSEVLIIDDVGTEKITRNNVVDVLYTILKYRGDYMKPTFITSNLTKDQYYTLIHSKNVDISRIDISRLKEQLDVLMPEVLMTGENRRDKA